MNRIAELIGASQAVRGERIQSLWDGYGEVVRYALVDAPLASVVVKHVKPPKSKGRSHQRKLRSYAVEQAWYSDWATQCDSGCRVPRCFGAERSGDDWLFVLEDLDAAGFDHRSRWLSDTQLDACIRWLAHFHAGFLGLSPAGLWETGTYWHLQTRPDEFAAMPSGALRRAAPQIDLRLSAARFTTLVHGDAKPANFCFSADGRSVAAVDFQYVGGGCGMKDLAYLLSGEDRRACERGLDVYFDALRQALGESEDPAAVEREWRALFPWALADFHRFLAGWAPGHGVSKHGAALTDAVLRELG